MEENKLKEQENIVNENSPKHETEDLRKPKSHNRIRDIKLNGGQSPQKQGEIQIDTDEKPVQKIEEK